MNVAARFMSLVASTCRRSLKSLTNERGSIQLLPLFRDVGSLQELRVENNLSSQSDIPAPAARSLRLFGDEANDMTLMAGSPLGLVVGIFVEEDP